jgi:hypothetical protein
MVTHNMAAHPPPMLSTCIAGRTPLQELEQSTTRSRNYTGAVDTTVTVLRELLACRAARQWAWQGCLVQDILTTPGALDGFPPALVTHICSYVPLYLYHS